MPKVGATSDTWDEKKARAEVLSGVVRILGNPVRREAQTYFFRDAIVLLRTSKRFNPRPGIINYLTDAK